MSNNNIYEIEKHVENTRKQMNFYLLLIIISKFEIHKTLSCNQKRFEISI